MGKRGPRPLPLKILKGRGTVRNDRHRADVLVPVVAKIPRPRASLGKGAAREWRVVAKRLHGLGILTNLDLGALEAYSIARARALDCEAELVRDGLTIATPQGRKRHPSLCTAERAWADARKYELQFGLTPSARRGLNMSETEPASAASAAKHARYFGARGSGNGA